MSSTSSIPKIKILFLGDSGVGKTALLRQFLEGKFTQTLATTGFDIEFKVMEIQNRQVKLEIWDTAGQETYRAIIPSHYRKTKGVILVYDVTKPDTLKNLRKWIQQLELYVDPTPPMIVVDSIGAFKHTNTSAKSGEGVKGIFEDLVYGIIFNEYMEKEEGARGSTPGVRLDDPAGSGPQAKAAKALMTSRPRTFKILLLGDVSVGKTALLRQFSYGEFNPGQASTLWYDVEFKEMVIQNHRVRLALWDTGGQEKFKSLPPVVFHKARAAVLVYDVSNPGSLEGLNEWVRQLQKHADQIPMIVVGNKADLLPTDADEQVPALCAQAEQFAKRVGAFKHVNASARSGEGVNGVFEDLVYEILFNVYTTVEEESERLASAVVLRAPQPAPDPGECWC
ncbi:hypothetical protein FRC00_005288 [Tulasnella sp. 408]|nr:hypothetical protein FRC00_005288 [Tulasnella sp. 408]